MNSSMISFTSLNHFPLQMINLASVAGNFIDVGIMVLLLTVAQQYALFMAIAVAIGLGCGSLGISLLDIVVRLLGVDMVNGGFGYLLLFMALGQGIGGPLAGMNTHFMFLATFLASIREDPGRITAKISKFRCHLWILRGQGWRLPTQFPPFRHFLDLFYNCQKTIIVIQRT